MSTPIAEKGSSSSATRGSDRSSAPLALPEAREVRMLSDSVDQNPIMPVSERTKTFQNCPNVRSLDGCSSIGPSPPARPMTQTSSTPP